MDILENNTIQQLGEILQHYFKKAMHFIGTWILMLLSIHDAVETKQLLDGTESTCSSIEDTEQFLDATEQIDKAVDTKQLLDTTKPIIDQFIDSKQQQQVPLTSTTNTKQLLEVDTKKLSDKQKRSIQLLNIKNDALRQQLQEKQRELTKLLAENAAIKEKYKAERKSGKSTSQNAVQKQQQETQQELTKVPAENNGLKEKYETERNKFVTGQSSTALKEPPKSSEESETESFISAGKYETENIEEPSFQNTELKLVPERREKPAPEEETDLAALKKKYEAECKKFKNMKKSLVKELKAVRAEKQKEKASADEREAALRKKCHDLQDQLRNNAHCEGGLVTEISRLRSRLIKEYHQNATLITQFESFQTELKRIERSVTSKPLHFNSLHFKKRSNVMQAAGK